MFIQRRSTEQLVNRVIDAQWPGDPREIPVLGRLPAPGSGLVSPLPLGEGTLLLCASLAVALLITCPTAVPRGQHCCAPEQFLGVRGGVGSPALCRHKGAFPLAASSQQAPAFSKHFHA